MDSSFFTDAIHYWQYARWYERRTNWASSVPILIKDIILHIGKMCPHTNKLPGTRKSFLVYRSVNLAADQRVINNMYHIKNVNAYDSRLKQWMAKFHGMAT